MAVTSYRGRVHVCDTEAELPAAVKDGERALALDSEKCFITVNESWVEESAGGGGPHTHPISDVVDLQASLNFLGASIGDCQLSSEKGQANGYASLGADGKVPSAQLPAGGSDPFVAKLVQSADVSTGANTTPVNLPGLVFDFEANGIYLLDFVLMMRAAATTTGAGVQINTSVAVTAVQAAFVHQLANTGTLTGGSSIADDASVGVSSGRPAANVIVPVIGSGLLIAGANGGTAQLRLRSEINAVLTAVGGGVFRAMKMN